MFPKIEKGPDDHGTFKAETQLDLTSSELQGWFTRLAGPVKASD